MELACLVDQATTFAEERLHPGANDRFGGTDVIRPEGGIACIFGKPDSLPKDVQVKCP
jgi:hypothetical protein